MNNIYKQPNQIVVLEQSLIMLNVYFVRNMELTRSINLNLTKHFPAVTGDVETFVINAYLYATDRLP